MQQQQPMSVKAMIASYGRPLTAEELSTCLGVDVQIVRKYARKQVIPHFRLGTMLRFEPKAVCQWYDNQ